MTKLKTKPKKKMMTKSEAGRLGAAATLAKLTRSQLSQKMTKAVNARWRRARAARRAAK